MIEVTVVENKLLKHPTTETVLKSYDALCEGARRNFNRDCELLPTFALICLDGPNHCPCELIIPAPWRDRDEKYEYYDFIKKMAADTMAVAVAHMGECWISQVIATPGLSAKEAIEQHQYKQASDDPKRQEIVQVVLASTLTRPRNRTRFAHIHRGGRKPRIGPWEENEAYSFKGALFDLLPVIGN